MQTFSINDIIRTIKEENKTYLTNYYEKGYEIGFGKGGNYKGHSHLFFYDILFSPQKMFIKDENNMHDCYLSIIPPRSFMNDIKIGDFFFFKFCPTCDSFCLPEKTDKILHESSVGFFTKEASFYSCWYRNPNLKQSIWIDATPESLIVNFNNEEIISIIA